MVEGVACMCHVGRVAGELGLARGGGVRVGGLFDRLRANGIGKRPYGGEWGMQWGSWGELVRSCSNSLNLSSMFTVLA